MPVATLIVAAAFVFVTVIGGIVVIVHPDTLSFEKYATLVTGIAGSAGLLGVGRGIHAASTASGTPPT